MGPFAALFLSTVLGSGAALAGTCDIVMNSELKGLSVPTRMVHTFGMNGKTQLIKETISAGDKVYSRRNDGSWRVKTSMSTEDSARESWSHRDGCKVEGSEAVDGEMADIVSVPKDTQYWISQKSGLVLKFRGAGPDWLLTERRYYDNVQVPVDKATPDP